MRLPRLKNLNLRFRLWFYKRYGIKYLAWRTRRKDKISVLFVLSSLGAWKTESLFAEMLKHPRFAPMLLLTDCYDEDDRERLADYSLGKNYPFIKLDGKISKIKDVYKADIIFYQKPYWGYLDPSISFYNNLGSLFCFVQYSFRTSCLGPAVSQGLFNNCWQLYYENTSLLRQYRGYMKARMKNDYATGIPPMDELLLPKGNYEDPWQGESEVRKRIIYAPHHSFNPENWWQSSTFLETGEFMIELAEKYADKVQWAFKPHPIFRSKLETYWGKEKVDEYFRRWAAIGQVEEGKYNSLFKYSDAMIHDCGSFIMEYLYTEKPVMYLMRSDKLYDSFNDFAKEALSLHYHGWNGNDIECFIQDVISEEDPKKEERLLFLRESLTPPQGKTATENIIDCILDPEAAKLLQPE